MLRCALDFRIGSISSIHASHKHFRSGPKNRPSFTLIGCSESGHGGLLGSVDITTAVPQKAAACRDAEIGWVGSKPSEKAMSTMRRFAVPEFLLWLGGAEESHGI